MSSPIAPCIAGAIFVRFIAALIGMLGDKSGESGGRNARLPSPTVFEFDAINGAFGRMAGPKPGGGE